MKFNNTVALTRLGDDPAATVSIHYTVRRSCLTRPFSRCFCDTDTRRSIYIFRGQLCCWFPVMVGTMPTVSVAMLSRFRPWLALGLPTLNIVYYVCTAVRHRFKFPPPDIFACHR